MDKKRVLYAVEWLIALSACSYLVYRLVVFDDYASLWASLGEMGWQEWSALVLCVALMPVNMAIEAWRWKTLMNDRLPVSDSQYIPWREAHRQVYYSKLAGLVTPWRLGEYPARALIQGEWKKTLSMGAVGSATMTAAIVLAGLTALSGMGVAGCLGRLEHDRLALQAYLLLVIGALVALLVFLALAPRLLRRWADVSRRLILLSLGQSFVRLLCWCVQLALVLYALDAIFNPQSSIFNLQSLILNLPVYYLLVTVTPNVPVAEVGVRGAWAVFLFGSVNAALAGVLLWGINTLLPCLISPFLIKKKK